MPRRRTFAAGIPALRSLGCRQRFAILAPLVCIRRLSWHGQPLTDDAVGNIGCRVIMYRGIWE